MAREEEAPESKKRGAGNSRHYPSFELLEDRTLPSTITWVNRGSATSDTDNFNAVFGSQAATARAEVDAALMYWQNAIQNFNYADGTDTMRLTISVNPADHTNDAITIPGLSLDAQGKPEAALIELGAGTDGHGGGYYIDPTPYDSSEYQQQINPYAADSLPGTAAWYKADLLTLTLHETLHALGLNADPREAFQQNLHGYVQSTGQADAVDHPGVLFTFNGPDVRALFTSDDGEMTDMGRATDLARPGNSYTDPATQITYTGGWDILNPVYYLGRRMLISPTDVLLLKDAYGYTVNMPGTLNGPAPTPPAPTPPSPTPPAPTPPPSAPSPTPAPTQPPTTTGLPPWMVVVDQYLQGKAAQQQSPAPPPTPPAPPSPPSPPSVSTPTPTPAPSPPPAPSQPPPTTGLPPWMVVVDQYLQGKAAQQQSPAPPPTPPTPPSPPSPSLVSTPTPTTPTSALPPWMVAVYRYLHRPLPGDDDSLS